MIRINLGEDRLEKGAKAASSKSKFDLGKIFVPIAKKFKLDLAGVLTLIVGAGLSLLFPLFLEQYKTYVISDFTIKKKKLQVQTDQLAREIGRLTPYQKELESYESQKQLVASRISVVRELLTSRNAPVTILDVVGQNLLRQMWVNNVDLVFGESEGTLQLSGSSYSNEEIADYVDRLASSVYLKEVSLEDVNTRTEDKIEVRGFQINAKTKDGALGAGGAAKANSAADAGRAPQSIAQKGTVKEAKDVSKDAGKDAVKDLGKNTAKDAGKGKGMGGS